MMQKLETVSVIGDGNDVIFHSPNGAKITIASGVYTTGSNIVAGHMGVSYTATDGCITFVGWPGKVEQKLPEIEEIEPETIEI